MSWIINFIKKLCENRSKKNLIKAECDSYIYGSGYVRVTKFGFKYINPKNVLIVKERGRNE